MWVNQQLNTYIESNTKSGSFFLPVIHPYKDLNILMMTDKMVQNNELNFIGISISEKDLGYGLIHKIRNLKSIKKLLSKKKKTILLHMLGCGHPLNMLIYVCLGVDIFDSRSWSNSIISGDNLMTYPSSYLDVIDCKCETCKKDELDYITKSLLHNVLSYERVTNSIKRWIENGEVYEVLDNFIYNEKILKELKE